MGDRMAALTAALAQLDALPGTMRMSCSSVYETEPWAVADQPHFLNLCVGYETTMEPAAFLAACKQVEASIGRVDGPRWGPRLIDVDILLFGNQVVNLTEPDLQIPHPRMHQRAFALVPLAEIAPDVIVPPDGLPVSSLLDAVDGRDGVVLWAPPPR